MVAARVVLIMSPGNVSIVGGIIISEKCQEKFGCLKWAQLVDTDSPNPYGATYAPSSTPSGSSDSSTVVLSPDEYDRLHQLEFSQTSHSTTYAFSTCMNAYIASPQKTWILTQESHCT